MANVLDRVVVESSEGSSGEQHLRAFKSNSQKRPVKPASQIQTKLDSWLMQMPVMNEN